MGEVPCGVIPGARSATGNLERWGRLPLDSRVRGNDSLLILRRIERRLHVAGFVLLRKQDHAMRGVLELLEVVALQSAELHHQDARLRPFAVAAELALA